MTNLHRERFFPAYMPAPIIVEPLLIRFYAILSPNIMSFLPI